VPSGRGFRRSGKFRGKVHEDRAGEVSLQVILVSHWMLRVLGAGSQAPADVQEQGRLFALERVTQLGRVDQG
jgi:hypothetical protein